MTTNDEMRLVMGSSELFNRRATKTQLVLACAMCIRSLTIVQRRRGSENELQQTIFFWQVVGTDMISSLRRTSPHVFCVTRSGGLGVGCIEADFCKFFVAF